MKELIKKEVEKLFLAVWSPWGEEKESDIDISFGFIFKSEPNTLCIVSVDKDELWSPHISFEALPESNYFWDDFYPRIKMYMRAEDGDLMIGKEYYDVTKSKIFNKIVGNEIEGIEFINFEGNPDPFGVKFLFKDDFIISLPNSGGNTVETQFFNSNNSIDNFKRLGNLIFTKV